jgi:hypothetical protein
MGRFAGTETISRTPGAENHVAAAPTGPAPLNEILFRCRLQFFDAPAHIILAHLLKSLARSHNRYDTAFGITGDSASGERWPS